MLGDNIAAVVIGDGVQIADGTTITLSRAAVTVAVYTLGLLTVATVSFRIRDVQ